MVCFHVSFKTINSINHKVLLGMLEHGTTLVCISGKMLEMHPLPQRVPEGSILGYTSVFTLIACQQL